MKKTGLEKHAAIRKKSLDSNQYTISLLKEGYRVGHIGQQFMDSIQSQLMTLLGDLIIRYTRGESTSVKVETAQSILLSILYSVDACLSGFEHPQDALAYLQEYKIEVIHQKGLEHVASCLAESKLLYQEIKNNKMDVANKAYESTIGQSLPDFFKNYDLIFKAQDTMASIDYPLLFDDMRIKGIFYIRQYLIKLGMETKFCSLFAQEDIKRLLFNYGRVYRIDYREALINVFEIILTNAIFSVMTGNFPNKLGISKNQYDLLKERLDRLNQTQCELLINNAIERLIEDLHLELPQLKEYIWNYNTIIIPRFLSALDHESLSNVVILDEAENIPIDIFFDEGNRMDNDSFRNLVEKIMQCSSDTDQKISIISSSIRSLGDFIDVLEADCLFGDEFNVLFNTLGDLELSILARIVFAEEIQNKSNGFSLQKVGETELDRDWQIEYARFIQDLSKEKLISIDKYIHSNYEGA